MLIVRPGRSCLSSPGWIYRARRRPPMPQHPTETALTLHTVFPSVLYCMIFLRVCCAQFADLSTIHRTLTWPADGGSTLLLIKNRNQNSLTRHHQNMARFQWCPFDMFDYLSSLTKSGQIFAKNDRWMPRTLSPPSTTRLEPTLKLPAREARKMAAPAMFSFSPIRLAGSISFISSV